MGQGWSLIPVTIYAFFTGVDAVIVSFRILSLDLSQEPLVAAAGFVLAGLGGLASSPFFQWFRDNKAVRWIAIADLAGVTAAIWAVTFYNVQ